MTENKTPFQKLLSRKIFGLSLLHIFRKRFEKNVVKAGIDFTEFLSNSAFSRILMHKCNLEDNARREKET